MSRVDSYADRVLLRIVRTIVLTIELDLPLALMKDDKILSARHDSSLRRESVIGDDDTTGATFPPEMLPVCSSGDRSVTYCPHGQCADSVVPCPNCITVSFGSSASSMKGNA